MALPRLLTMITYYGETFEDYNTPKATPDHPIYSHFLYPYLLT